MSGRSNRSARVVICDDVAWSEPAPRGRRTASQADPTAWAPSFESRFAARRAALEREGLHLGDDVASHGPHRADDDVLADEYRGDGALGRRFDRPVRRRADETVRRVERDLGRGDEVGDAGLPPVIEYTDALDDEAVWGPRPKLMASENGGRRTVVITGHGAERHLVPRGGAHTAVPTHFRGFAADRTAMWAVLLCVIVLLVAIGSH